MILQFDTMPIEEKVGPQLNLSYLKLLQEHSPIHQSI